MIKYLLALFFSQMLNQMFVGTYTFEGEIRQPRPGVPFSCVAPSLSYFVRLEIQKSGPGFSVIDPDYPSSLYLSSERQDYSLRISHLLLYKGDVAISRSFRLSFENNQPVIRGYLVGHRGNEIVCGNTFILPGVKHEDQGHSRRAHRALR